MKQHRRGHYTGNTYDLPRATHQYNTRAQGTRVGPMAQHVAILARNLQGHHQANVVIEPTTGASLEYRHLVKAPTKSIWENSFANEIGQLSQGFGTRMQSGTNTIFFIPKGKVTAGRTVTYGRIVAEIRPQKAETHHTRLTVGGNVTNFPGDVTTSTADLITAKLIFNSVLSTKNTKLMCADIANFYLNNPMDRYEYMKLPLVIIPEEIIQQYNLRNLEHKGFVYMEIQKGIYGLPQAGKIANDKLKLHLAKYGYKPAPITPVLWRHKTRPLQFSLVADDSGIKYERQEDITHILDALKTIHKISEDWDGKLCCGQNL